MQDENYANGLTTDGLPCFAAGLPFSTFLQYSNYASKRQNPSGTLLVPINSYATGDYSSYVLRQVRWYCERKPAPAVMLNLFDMHLANELERYVSRIEYGASSHDANTFYRLLSVFSRYESMICMSVGSAILYGSLAGMKVGLVHDEVISNIETQGSDRDFHARNNISESDLNRLRSTAYIESRYPGLVTASLTPNWSCRNAIAAMHPKAIATLLGWYD